MRDHTKTAHRILDWYDQHARDLPWRIPAHSTVTPDPYRIWLSEIMLQQTTVVVVKDYFQTFTRRWPDVQALANAEDAAVMAAWAGLGYYARARNLLKCARIVSQDHNGRFPDSQDALQALPGIGPYTSAAIAAIAYDQPATVVDGNVERVMSRLFMITQPLPGSKPLLKKHAASLTPQTRPGDYAQAVMDLGATICTPRKPVCSLCPLQDVCKAHAAGIAETLPQKTPKPAKPTRYGIAYLAQRKDGAWLLETRAPKGLLGGMLGLPGTEWAEDTPVEAPPIAAKWITRKAITRHTFTHFHLILDVAATITTDAIPDRGSFVASGSVSPDDLPTVMRKALLQGLSILNDQNPNNDV